jgi:hypothetical protein
MAQHGRWCDPEPTAVSKLPVKAHLSEKKSGLLI